MKEGVAILGAINGEGDVLGRAERLKPCAEK